MSLSDLQQRVTRLTPHAREQLAAKLDEMDNRADQASDGLNHEGAPTTLVAYFVTTTGTDLPIDELRHFLHGLLPAHMVPSLFCRVDQFQRTPHGKVDTRALPDPLPAGHVATEMHLPEVSHVEKELVKIWSSVLNVVRIGREDSFFELGGDSLLAIRLLGLIRERWDVDLTIADLFDHPTIGAGASQIEAVLWARNSKRSDDGNDAREREQVEF